MFREVGVKSASGQRGGARARNTSNIAASTQAVRSLSLGVERLLQARGRGLRCRRRLICRTERLLLLHDEGRQLLVDGVIPCQLLLKLRDACYHRGLSDRRRRHHIVRGCGLKIQLP